MTNKNKNTQTDHKMLISIFFNETDLKLWRMKRLQFVQRSMRLQNGKRVLGTFSGAAPELAFVIFRFVNHMRDLNELVQRIVDSSFRRRSP